MLPAISVDARQRVDPRVPFLVVLPVVFLRCRTVLQSSQGASQRLVQAGWAMVRSDGLVVVACLGADDCPVASLGCDGEGGRLGGLPVRDYAVVRVRLSRVGRLDERFPTAVENKGQRANLAGVRVGYEDAREVGYEASRIGIAYLERSFLPYGRCPTRVSKGPRLAAVEV